MKLAYISIVLITSIGAQAETNETSHSSGIFSAQAINLSGVYTAHSTFSVTATSPDGRSKVVARMLNPDSDNEKFVLDVSGKIGSRQVEIAYGPNAELLWSPDSHAFFVTENDGGIVGNYLLKVVGEFKGKLVVRDLTPFMSKVFGHPVRCFDPEEPNIAGITWLESSRRVIVAAEIQPHSNCDSMGTFKAYEVDPWNMSVIRKYDQIDAKSKFAVELGPELLNAWDDCVHNPKICYIPQLHSEIKPTGSAQHNSPRSGRR